MNHPWEVLYQAYQVRLQAHHLSLLFYNKLVMWLKGIHCILLDFDLIKHCKCQICLISIFIKFTEDLTRTCIIMLSSKCKCFMHYNLHLLVHKMQSFWMKFHVIFMPHLCKYNSFWTLCNTSPSLYIKELIGDKKHMIYHPTTEQHKDMHKTTAKGHCSGLQQWHHLHYQVSSSRLLTKSASN